MGAALEIVDRLRMPLAEVSGLSCLRRSGGALLVAVGDNDASLATADVGADGAVGEWRVVTSDELGARPDAAVRFRQLEAVAVDGAGRAWVVTEGTSLLGGIDLAAGATVGGGIAGTRPPCRSWTATGACATRRGLRGCFSWPAGTCSSPRRRTRAGLVEFGPAGEDPLGVSGATLLATDAAFTLPVGAPDGQPASLVALAWWPLPRARRRPSADLSDLALDGSGGVWVLSDKRRRIGRLRIPLAAGDEVLLEPLADLPKGIGKPEGLAVAARRPHRRRRRSQGRPSQPLGLAGFRRLTARGGRRPSRWGTLQPARESGLRA